MDTSVLVNEPETIQTMLARVARDVIEEFANVLVEPADDEVAYASRECMLGRTALHGGVTGVVSVAAPVGLCQAMAGGVLKDGQSGDDAGTTRASHALAELVNIIAGNLATAIQAPEHVWLSPPVVEESSRDDWVVMGGSNQTVRFNVEGWPLLASLQMVGSSRS